LFCISFHFTSFRFVSSLLYVAMDYESDDYLSLQPNPESFDYLSIDNHVTPSHPIPSHSNAYTSAHGNYSSQPPFQALVEFSRFCLAHGRGEVTFGQHRPTRAPRTSPHQRALITSFQELADSRPHASQSGRRLRIIGSDRGASHDYVSRLLGHGHGGVSVIFKGRKIMTLDS
jgi:hypothetical protein